MDIRRIFKIIALVGLILAPLTSALFIQDAWKKSYPILNALDYSYLLFVLMVLYDRWDPFYFHTTKGIMWLWNSKVSWSMTAEWERVASQEPVTAIYEALKASYPDAVPWMNGEREKIIKLPIGCMVRIRQVMTFDGIEGESTIVSIDIGDLVVPFRSATEILDAIVGLLTVSHKALRPDAERYTFRVTMPGPNPYFGLFVRQLRLPKQQLVSFICEFTEYIGPIEEQVQVSDKRISFVAHSVSTLQTLSRRYVTLATLDLTSSG